MNRSTTHKVVNFVAFQACWLACVLGAAHDRAWLGPAAVAAALMVHALLSVRPAVQARMILAAAAVGYAVDSGLTAAGVLQFPSGAGTASPWMAPVWIAALWLVFASTLDCSMRWMRRRYLVGAGLGAVSGPLCYIAGEKLGAVTLPSPPTPGLLALATAWGVVVPIALWLVERTVPREPA